MNPTARRRNVEKQVQPRQPPVNLQVAGRTGLKRYGGSIFEEFHPKLSGTQAVRVYQEMATNDAVVGGVLRAVETLMRQAEWHVRPSGDSRQELRDAEFLQQCKDDMSHTWDDMLPEILTMLPYGFSYLELCYKRRLGDSSDPRMRSKYSDGLVGWRKIELRSQDTLQEWRFDDEGGIDGMVQRAPPDFQERFIPIEKALLFRPTTAKSNPEGISILRTAYRSWYFLKRIQEFEAIGIERDLAGLPVLRVPPEIMDANAPAALKALRSDLEQMVAEVKRDEREGLVIPAAETAAGKTGWDFSLVSSGGRRQLDTNVIITRYEQRIAMSALAEFLLLGMDGVGSFALASSKTHIFAMAVGVWLRGIAAVFNRFAVPRLFELNGMRGEKYPYFEPGDIESPSLEAVGAFIANLTKVGVIIPDEALHRKVREIASLPEPDEKTARVPEVKPNVRLDGDHTRSDQN